MTAPTTLSRSRFRFLCALLFCTGMTSLVFQIIWLRGFGIILGSTIYSMSSVITVFMLGLALGSFLMSQLLKRGRWLAAHPLAAYGSVELLVGLSALLVTWTLFTHQGFYLSLSGSPTAPLLKLLATQFTVCAALIAVPTTLMGMTLPLVSQLVTDRRQVSALYGINTIGGATGSIVASFVLIYYLGCVRAGAVAAALNGLIFCAAVLTSRYFPPVPAGAEETDDGAPAATLAAENRLLGRPLLLTLAVFSGFIALSCEITWTRFLSLAFGNRVYVTSIALALILLFMGQAARMSSALLRGPNPLWRILLYSCAFTLISFSAAFLLERPALQASHPGIVVLFILVMVVFPATALGLLFPLTLAARPAGVDNPASWVGLVYGFNTLASLVGSLASGYVLINLIGSNGLIAFNSALLVLSLLGLVYAFRQHFKPSDHALAAVAGLGFLAVILPRSTEVPPVVDATSAVVSSEDAHGIFSVVRMDAGRLRVLNNRTDLVYLYGDPTTQYVQESQAYLPILYAPQLERVLNIGSGYGITAGAFSRVAEVRAIEAVEIVPALVEHANLFSPGNHRYFDNPRIQVHVTDGRHFLATTPERYDIISINVSDPYLPGSSSLFSREFYEMARSRLKPGGVLAQHIFGPDIASLYHGIHEVFPHVKAIPAYGNGLTLIASAEPLRPHQREVFLRQYDEGRALFGPIGLDNGLAGFEELIALGDEKLQELASRAPEFRNSDDMPTLEFRRLPGKVGLFYSNN
ncbi:spermidine synthase [Archangium gephyra]|uniref:Polyamine aminopropyltransferase n=1 Tax=Archangium gephyra TaxID=48 RepID=A0AAC8TDK1_9BACT|nr:fused MFS/spermidine synthase [Archangium gephyra]AKJ02070.1 Spermidine synthase [Archangium gephyra]REG34872.1 spermidine synthase [Archangium gephyra]